MLGIDVLLLIDLRNLMIAAAIGFLIGFERQWEEIRDGEDASFAGARTFTLVSFVGALTGLISPGLILPSVVFAGVALLTAIAYWSQAKKEPASGGTSETALLVSFLLGMAAVRDHVLIASAAGVFVAFLLSIKRYTERLAKLLTEQEVRAILRFLVITIIVLPLTPDTDMGPYGAINLQEIWLMVVFISGLSFLGYWLMRFQSRRRAVLMTGLLGGLASSTATTLSISRLVRNGIVRPIMGASGILLASTMMIIRVGVIVAVVALPIFLAMWPVIVVAVISALIVSTLLIGADTGADPDIEEVGLSNPLELKSALIFAGLLGLVTVASAYGTDVYGDEALYILAMMAGWVDVDAITLATSRNNAVSMITERAAINVICVAVVANAVSKAIYAGGFGGTRLAVSVGVGLLIVVIRGALSYWMILRQFV